MNKSVQVVMVSSAMAALFVAAAVPAGAASAPPQTVPVVEQNRPALRVSEDGLAHPDVPDQSGAAAGVVETDLDTVPVVPEVSPGVTVPEAQVADPESDEPVLDGAPSRSVETHGASMVGVTWEGVAPERVEVRSQDGAGQWTDWQVLEAEGDLGGASGGTEPWWTGGSARVEVRAWRGGTPVADDLTLAAISTEVTMTDEELAGYAGSGGSGGSGGGLSGSVTDLPAVANGLLAMGSAPTMPTVITRGQWGADPNLMTWAPQYANTTVAAVLHHTVGKNTYTAAESPGIVRGIYSYHALSRGWGDIGYNVLIDQYGQIFEGRYGGLSLPVISAHAGGFNTGTFGVSMMGDYSTVVPSAALKESVARIMAWKLGGSYVFDTWSPVAYTTPGHSTSRFSPGQVVTIYRIIGHRDVAYTSCPGNGGYSIIPWLRNRVNELVGAAKTPIWQNWAAQGGGGGLWGSVYQLETDVPGGSAAYFSGGYTATYLPGVGVHQISPTIRPGWLAAGGVDGAGFPTSFEFAVGDGRGRAQSFYAGGTVVQTPQTGARWISGPLRQRWWDEGGATGWLKYPTRSQTAVGDGRGSFIEFETTGTVIYSAATGAAAISGALRSEWWRLGGATGSLGYPQRSQQGVGDGRGLFIEFEKGSSILWSPTTGARTIGGALRDAWWRSGGAVGVLGYPTFSQKAVGDGVGTFVEFDKSGSILSTSATGAHFIYGDARIYWWAGGGISGLGYPTGDQKVNPGGGTQVDFAAATIVSFPATGTHAVWGAIRDRWRAAGGGATLGNPSAEPANFTSRAGGYSTFSTGSLIAWSAGTGAQIVTAPFVAAWNARGGAAGRLGLPIGEAVTVSGVTTQRFEGGTLTMRDGQISG